MNVVNRNNFGKYFAKVNRCITELIDEGFGAPMVGPNPRSLRRNPN